MANTKADRTLAPTSSETSLFLRDSFVVSSSSTRHILPEAAPKGKLFTSIGMEIHAEERRGVKGLIGLITLGLTGKHPVKDSAEEAPAFAVKVVLEGFFETLDREVRNDGDITEKDADSVMTTLLPMASVKIREMAFDMGYSNVRQPIGFSHKLFNVAKVQTTKKRAKKAPKISSVE